MISISWQKVIFAFNDNQQVGYHLWEGTRLPKQPRTVYEHSETDFDRKENLREWDIATQE